MVIHYELILLYSAGVTPKDCVRYWGYSRGTAYRFYRIYRLARERASRVILDRNSVSPGRERKSKNLDAFTFKRRVSPKEKWDWVIDKDGTVRAKKKRVQ